MTEKFPTLTEIKEAHQRILPFINKTPILTSESINEISGTQICFKCENFQRVGAFKFRGASNAILSLSTEEKKHGVATHSSGNHAQGVALAAKMNNIPAHIVMPNTAPEVKVKAILSYGAKITFCEPTQKAREDTLAAVVSKTKATIVHGFDDYRIIAGQATAALELIEKQNALDYILTPVGGGGLLSGTALIAHYLSPETKVIAGEPEGADDTFRSMKAGKIVGNENPGTIADGLLTNICEKTFRIMQEHVEEVITVSDKEIVEAMRLLWERMKIVVEPSGAVPLAALLKEKEKFKNKRTGIILSGGNVDLSKLPF